MCSLWMIDMRSAAKRAESTRLAHGRERPRGLSRRQVAASVLSLRTTSGVDVGKGDGFKGLWIIQLTVTVVWTEEQILSILQLNLVCRPIDRGSALPRVSRFCK